MVYTSISFPVLLDKGNVGNEVSGFQEKNNFPPHVVLSAFYPWSAVLSPQSAFYTDWVENLEGN